MPGAAGYSLDQDPIGAFGDVIQGEALHPALARLSQLHTQFRIAQKEGKNVSNLGWIP